MILVSKEKIYIFSIYIGIYRKNNYNMKKRRIKFYAQIQRLDDSQLPKQIKKTIDQKSTVKWIEEVIQDTNNLE